MPKSPSIYTKLTPKKRSLFGYSRLWLAPDHILLLTSTAFAQEYKRFAISEIQSVVVTESPAPIVLQIVMIFAALGWMALWFAIASKFEKWSIAAIGALALIWPIVDYARGPRCRCSLHTRVTHQLLEPVSRIRIANSFLGIVQPMIEAAQGVLPEQLSVPETPSETWTAPPPELVSSPGYLPEVLFGLFLIDAILVWAAAHYPKLQEIGGVLLNLIFCELVLIPVAFIRRKGRDPRLIVYVIIGLAVLGLGFDLKTIGGVIGGWYLSVLEKAKNGDKTTSIIELFPLSRETVISCYWRAAAGIIGLAAAFYERRRPMR